MEASAFVVTSFLLLLTCQAGPAHSSSVDSRGDEIISSSLTLTDAINGVRGLVNVHRNDPFSVEDLRRIFTVDATASLGSTSNSSKSNSTTSGCKKMTLLDQFGKLTLHTANFTATTLNVLNQYVNGIVECVENDDLFYFMKCGFEYLYDDLTSTITLLEALWYNGRQSLSNIVAIVEMTKKCI